MKKKKLTLGISAIIVTILVALDQVTKYLAVVFLRNNKPVSIIPDVFEFQYLENRSAAFGMDPVSLLHKLFSIQAFHDDPELFLRVKMGFFIVFTISMVMVFIYIYTRIPDKKRFYSMDLILILFISGAIGNFIDRVTLQYVVDFFYFKLIDFPIFNVADIYVTVAAFLMVFLMLFYYKEEDLEEIFPSKKKPKIKEQA